VGREKLARKLTQEGQGNTVKGRKRKSEKCKAPAFILKSILVVKGDSCSFREKVPGEGLRGGVGGGGITIGRVRKKRGWMEALYKVWAELFLKI